MTTVEQCHAGGEWEVGWRQWAAGAGVMVGGLAASSPLSQYACLPYLEKLWHFHLGLRQGMHILHLAQKQASLYINHPQTCIISNLGLGRAGTPPPGVGDTWQASGGGGKPCNNLPLEQGGFWEDSGGTGTVGQGSALPMCSLCTSDNLSPA